MSPSHLVPIEFDKLTGWAEDDHAAALRAFQNSCRDTVIEETRTGPLPCAAALALGANVTKRAARAFFESHFTAYCLIDPDKPAFVTGYYEPEVSGSYARDNRFNVSVHGLPPDLVTQISDQYRARFNDRITGTRETADGSVPYYTRAEIDDGTLEGQGLDLLYLDDPIELFYMQVQGSGLVHLDGGSCVRLTYAGKNGHPYTSIGKLLAERGEMSLDEIDMGRVKAWLRADPARGRALMAENESYIFFRTLGAEEGRDGPRGNEGVVLTPGRSLAVDATETPLGTPIFVVADDLPGEDTHFVKLMIAQDVGSAIKGRQRGDIFFGTGEAAGAVAGRTRHDAYFFVLLPKP